MYLHSFINFLSMLRHVLPDFNRTVKGCVPEIQSKLGRLSRDSHPPLSFLRSMKQRSNRKVIDYHTQQIPRQVEIMVQCLQHVVPHQGDESAIYAQCHQHNTAREMHVILHSFDSLAHFLDRVHCRSS